MTNLFFYLINWTIIIDELLFSIKVNYSVSFNADALILTLKPTRITTIINTKFSYEHII